MEGGGQRVILVDSSIEKELAGSFQFVLLLERFE